MRIHIREFVPYIGAYGGGMTLEYAVRIERLAESDGGGYRATVPDLPGCMSDGETPEKALKNVQEAIASWIEAAKEWKMEIPQPSPPMACAG
jgi:predicted RNase H-like HicB family nuclease